MKIGILPDGEQGKHNEAERAPRRSVAAKLTRRLLPAAVALSLAPAASCSSAHNKEASAFDGLKKADTVAASLYVSTILKNELDGGPTEDILSQTAGVLRAVPSLDPQVRTDLEVMQNARRSQNFLSQYIEEDKTPPLPAVPQAQKSIISEAMQGATLMHEVESLPLDQERYAAAHQKIMASGASTAITTKVLRYVESQQLDDVFSDLAIGASSPEEAHASLVQVRDPELRAIAERHFETTIAEDALRKLEDKEISKTQAQRVAKRWINSNGLKATMKRALADWKGTDETGMPQYSSGMPRVALQEAHYASTQALQNTTVPKPNFAGDANRQLAAEFDDASRKVEVRLGQIVAQRNNIGAVSVAKALPLAEHDLHATINLENVKGTATVPDVPSVVEAGRRGEPLANGERLNEFAQVIIADGQLELIFSKNAQVSTQAKQLIRQAFEQVKPFMVSAARTGELSKVRFVLGEPDDFNPYYLIGQREEIMVLPKDDSTTLDQLVSTWTHETVHSLVRDAFNAGALTKQQERMVVNTCTSLQENMYKNMQNTITTSVRQLTELEAKARPEHRAIFADMRKDAQAGTLVREMGNREFYDQVGSMRVNGCDKANEILTDSLAHYENLHGVSSKDLAYLNGTPEMDEFASQLEAQVVATSIYKKLNESHYVQTNWVGQERIGHSEENANELIASTMDALLTYEPQLAAAIKTMNAPDKQLTWQVIEMGSKIVRAKHPELDTIVVPLMHKLQRDITS